MKTNKKAILGMLVAIVMSLGVMNGVNSRISDSGFQQVSIGCGYMAGETEGGASGAWTAASALSGAAAGQINSYRWKFFRLDSCWLGNVGWCRCLCVIK